MFAVRTGLLIAAAIDTQLVVPSVVFALLEVFPSLGTSTSSYILLLFLIDCL